MDQDDEFWNLRVANRIGTQEQLLEHLNKSDHLKDTIYESSTLTRQDKSPPIRVSGKEFERVSFSKTRVSGILFRDCKFDRCQFIGSVIDHCEFHNCAFDSTNTYKLSISNTYINPLSFKRCLDPKKHQNLGVHLYQALLNNSRTNEQPEFERDAHFLFLRWKRFQERYEMSEKWKSGVMRKGKLEFTNTLFSWIRRWIWEKLFGSGLRMRYYIATVVVAILGLSFLNFALREQLGLSIDNMHISTCLEAAYFTIISLTTIGYGDIVPTTSFGQVVAIGQGIVGFFLFAVLAAMLFRKVTP